MSRSITQTSSSSSVVGTGTSVIVPVNTTTGFSAGDYVYTLPNGSVGTRATGNTGIGLDTQYSATTFVSSYIQPTAFRSVSYSPYQDAGYYSGTTRTGGSTVVSSTTLNSSGPDAYSRSCTLLNGNVVQVCSDSSGNIYMTIVSNTGTVVLAKTTVATDLYVGATSSGNFACCTLTNGNFVILWSYAPNVYSLKFQVYSSAGVAGTLSTVNTAPATVYNLCASGLSGGGFVWIGSTASGGSTNATFGAVNSSFGNLGYANLSSGLSSTCKAPQCIGLPASYGTNIWIAYQYDTNGNSYKSLISANSGGTQGISVVTTQYGDSGYSSKTCGITVLTDGTIVIASPYYGNMYAEKYTYTKATNTTGSLAYGSATYLTGAYGTQLFSTANNGYFCLADSAGGTPLTLKSIDSSNTVTSISSNIVSPDSVSWGTYSAVSWGGGVMSLLYKAPSTGYPTYTGYTSVPATNGVTFLTGASYTPTEGYYLMGVAATDAAANTTGQVIINGTAQLGSSYPTVTTPIYYSYQTTASQPIFGQRGSVNATTVTLKGLEA